MQEGVPRHFYHCLHLQMRFRILDADGQELAVGRDWEALRQQLRTAAQHSFATLPTPELERENLRDWDFNELPEQINFTRNGIQLRGYPALVAESDGSVALRILDAAERAESALQQGLTRLISWRLGARFKSLSRTIPNLQRMTLHYLGLGNQEQLRAELLEAVLERAFLYEQKLPRNKAEFETLFAQGALRLSSVSAEISKLVAEILQGYYQVRQALQGAVPAEALHDLQQQLAHLVYPGFLRKTPSQWLPHLPRYLRAMGIRLEKLRQAPDKDKQRSAVIKQLWQRYQQQAVRNAEREQYDAELIRFRWLLEELRVSQFAQELKTVVPISVKRLEEQWQKVKKYSK